MRFDYDEASGGFVHVESWPAIGHFAGEDFDDNVSGLVKRITLGKNFYGRKVFNNIWGTFSFGPDNSIFIGTYRGYVRFSSDAALPSAPQTRSPHEIIRE